MARFCKILLFIFALFFFLAATAISGVIIWAMTGPRDLSQYTHVIEESISNVVEGKVEIGGASLSFGGLQDLLYVRANDVKVFSKQGALLADLPEINLSYNLFYLVMGDFIPSRLTLYQPEIDLSQLFVSGDDESKLDISDFDTSRLSRIAVRDGKLKLFENAEVWKIEQAQADFAGKSVMVNAVLAPSAMEKVQLDLGTDLITQEYTAIATLQNFSTDHLRLVSPLFETMSFTLDGSVNIEGVGIENLPNKTGFEIAAFNGSYFNNEVLKGNLIFKTGRVIGSYDALSTVLDINAFSAEMEDGAKFVASGKVKNFQEMNLQAGITNMKSPNLQNYWPVGVAENGIAWMSKHLKNGLITDAVANVNITAAQIESGQIPADALNLKFKITGQDIEYHETLLPVKKANGNAEMDLDSLRILVSEADLGNSKVLNTSINIYDLRAEQEKISIEGTVQGSASDIADFYIKAGKGKKLIANSADVSGNSVATAKLDFPLASSLRLEDIGIDLTADIGKAKVANLFNTLSASDVNMSVALKGSDYALKGSGIALVSVKSDALKVAPSPAVFEARGNSNALEVSTAFDFKNSSIIVPVLAYEKLPGETARMLLKITQNNGPVTISALEFDSDSLLLSANGTMNADVSNIDTLNFNRIELGKNDLTGKVTMSPYPVIRLAGKTADLSKTIRYLNEDDSDDDSTDQYRIMLRADTVLMDNKMKNYDVSIDLQCGVNGCDTLSYKSRWNSMELTPTYVKIDSKNAGLFLRAFGIYENMRKGHLKVDATIKDDVYRGTFQITDFRIVGAQTLAKMLTLGSLTGIADTLSGNGISFRKLASEFAMNDDIMQIKGFRMVGAAIGITADGKIIRATDEADIEGNIIPAYTANTLLGKIPLIGDVLIGNDGVFALKYSMTGNTEDPDISVNPLSVLAPGFLKKVFE